MNFIYFSAQIVSYIRKNSPQNSRQSWVKWRSLVEQIHEFDFDKSQIKYFINDGKGSFGKTIFSENDIQKGLNSLSPEGRIQSLNLIKLYLAIEEKNKEQLNINFQNSIWRGLLKQATISIKEQEKIDLKIEEWFEKEEDKSFYTPINISATLGLIIADFILRWVLLWIYQTEQLEQVFGISPGAAEGWFYSSQLLWIPLLVLAFSLVRRNWINKKTKVLFTELKLERFKLGIEKNAWNYALIFVFGVSGIFIQSTLHEGGFVSLLVILTLYMVYLFFILNNLSVRYPHPREIFAQFDEVKNRNVYKDLSSEENDVEIINLEVKLRSLNEQMDAFVLEAALFGALAFSGFLSIISSDIFNIEQVGIFSSQINALFSSFVNFSISENESIVNSILSKEGLLSLLSYETLFCSIFFLSVIASRLRFNDLTDHVDRSLQLSRNFNEREEGLISSNPTNENKVNSESFTKKIRSQLRFGALKYNQIEPIMAYMKFFRTIGISTFFVIIVTGGLFVSFEIAMILLFISLLSVLYFKLEKFTTFFKSFTIRLQEFYFLADKYVHVISWVTVSIAFIFRTFHLPVGDYVMFVGFSLLFLHYLLRLILPEKNKVNESLGYDSSLIMVILSRLLKIGLSIFFLGFMFKAMHWPGASALLIIGLAFLGIHFYFIPKKTGKFTLNVLLSVTIGTWFFWVMFRYQHFFGVSILRWVVLALFLLSAVAVWKKWSTLESRLKQVIIIILPITIIAQFGFGLFAMQNLTLSYSDYSFSKEFRRVEINVFENKKNGGFADAASLEEMDSLHMNTKRLTELLASETPFFSSSALNSEYYHSALNASEDSVNLIVAEEAIIWINKSINYREVSYNDHVKSILLWRLGRLDEALQSAIKYKELYIEENGTEASSLVKINDWIALLGTELENQNQEVDIPTRKETPKIE